MLMKIKLKMFHVWGCHIVNTPSPQLRKYSFIFWQLSLFQQKVAYVIEKQVKFWHMSSLFHFCP